MKVLYVIDQKPDGYPGGIEYHLLDILSIFIKKSLPVYILFPERNCWRLRRYDAYKIKETEYEGGRVDDHRLRDADIEKIFGNILDDIDVDIVHFQSIRTFPISLVEVAKNRKKKVCMTLHEYYFWCINCIMLAPDFCWFQTDEEKCCACLSRNDYKVYKGFMTERRSYINYLLKTVDKIIVPSFYVRDVLMGLYRGISSKKCAVIELGIDKKLLENGRANRDLRKVDTLHIAFLGNFLYYKGNVTFLDLMKHYKNSKTIQFSIIGNIFDPSLVPSYKNLNVIGGYARNNVVETLHKASPDIILLLSNWPETFSYTLSEAIASGVPVITTDGGALRERVSKEAVGFLIPVEDPLPRAIKIIEDLRLHHDLVDFLRDRVWDARKRLKTVEDMVDDHFELYNLLV